MAETAGLSCRLCVVSSQQAVCSGEMRIEDLWDETSILYGVRVGIMTIFGDYAPIRFSAAFSEKSTRVFSQLPRD
eukprot:COSAG01_NODE_516_length_16026_cov_63.502857_19_plen_75_part_00